MLFAALREIDDAAPCKHTSRYPPAGRATRCNGTRPNPEGHSDEQKTGAMLEGGVQKPHCEDDVKHYFFIRQESDCGGC